MPCNDNLTAAKKAKNDEFYTQWVDIEREMNAYLEYDPDVFRDKTVLLPCDDPEWSNFTKYFALHFDQLGLKRLISTSYAKPAEFPCVMLPPRGKVFTLRRDVTGDGRTDFDDIEWEFLEGDGDFRSDEVKKLRDEADFVITNPPFSLFREFVAWLVESDVKFAVIGNMNAITYKEVFPLFKENKVWLGATGNGSDMAFAVPKGSEIRDADREKAERLGYPTNDEWDFTRLGNSCWLTNIEHGRRHTPLTLMTEADNIKFSKHKQVKGVGYKKYDNYDAIEVPFTDAIPADCDGVMGVPISFLDKYCPEQFEILGATQRGCHDLVPDTKKYDDYKEMRPDGTPTGSTGGKTNENANLAGNDGKKNHFINAKGHVIQSAYQRLFIRHKRTAK